MRSRYVTKRSVGKTHILIFKKGQFAEERGKVLQCYGLFNCPSAQSRPLSLSLADLQLFIKNKKSWLVHNEQFPSVSLTVPGRSGPLRNSAESVKVRV